MSQAEIDTALAALTVQVTANTDAAAAAVAVMNGFAARVDAAVAKAIADNPDVTALQLQGITDETAALKASAESLGEAVVANTPAEM
ncbi:MAG: hypothetical protein ABI790_05375 [Betaproteobacteria bacterium]